MTNKITRDLNIFDNNQDQARNKVSIQLSMLFWGTHFLEGFVWVIFTRFLTIISWTPRDVVLQKGLNIYQIFHLSNKKIMVPTGAINSIARLRHRRQM